MRIKFYRKPKKYRRYYSRLKPVELTVISVNYNGFEDTCEMVESLRKRLKSVVSEIIVVDNGSANNEAYEFLKKYPFIGTMRSNRNLGFAGGNNYAISIAKGKYILFLNNDTYIQEDHFREMLNFMEAHPEVAGASPLLRYNDEDQPVQFAGFTPLTTYTLRNSSIGLGQPMSEEYLQPKEIPYLHGAAMLIRKSLIDEIGHMPICYFLYYEELDWSLRFTEKGYKLYYLPCQTVFHKESRSTGKVSALRTYFMMRNRLVFAYRNRKGFVKLCAILYLLFGVAPRDIYKYIRMKRYKNAKAIYNGVASFFYYLYNSMVENNKDLPYDPQYDSYQY